MKIALMPRDKMTRRLNKNTQRKTDYSDKKQYRQQKHQRNKNNLETEIRKIPQLYEYFKRQTNEISYEKTWDVTKKWKP